MTKKKGLLTTTLTINSEDKLLATTHDLGLAIAFITKGYELIDLHPVPECECNGYAFHFEPDPALAKLEEAYWAGQFFVDAKHFNEVGLELSFRFAEVEKEYNNGTQ